MSGNTIPTPITDKNGKKTTVHKKPAATSGSNARTLPAKPVKSVADSVTATRPADAPALHHTPNVHATYRVATDLGEGNLIRQRFPIGGDKLVYDVILDGEYGFRVFNDVEHTGEYSDADMSAPSINDVGKSIYGQGSYLSNIMR